MSIDFADAFQVIAEALPDFSPSDEGRGEQITYFFLNDMVRFVANRAYPEFETLMLEFAALLEKLISEGDRNVRDLAHDALESLSGQDDRDFLASHFGPTTREMWDRICGGERG
jgi:hypothetical protein